MKLGLISDIHANTDHLRRALILLREHGAGTILCAGDLVDGDSEGNAAVELVKTQNIPCVQGNHDHAMTTDHYAEWLKNWDEASFGPPPWQYSDDALTDETIAYLRDLPLSRRFEWDSRRVLLTHASPWDQTTYVYGNGRPEHFRRIAEEADASIVILGHTHVPMAVEAEGVWVFNPGSVDGNRFEPYNSTCALLDLATLRYQVLDLQTGQPAQYLFTKISGDVHNSHTFEHNDQD